MKLILLPAVFLSLLGLTMMASISPDRVLIQSIFLVLSALAGWMAYRIGTKNILPVVWPLYLSIIVFLALTFVFGVATRGSVRWLSLGGVKLQGSEFAKPILLLVSVHFFSHTWPLEKKPLLKMFTAASVAAGLLISLVALQPDLGTAMTLAAIFVSGLIVSSPPKWLMGLAALLLIVFVPFGKLGLKDYQVRRLQTFINPYSDPKGAGYQVIQSTIAVGSGMWSGRGLGRGTQSQLKFLPERHTDFIFAGIVEELGFIGGVLALGLYFLILLGLIREGLKTDNRINRLTLAVAAGWLFFQSAVNILMNMGLMPVTGITLPFLSSGGSSLVSSAAMVGLALSTIK